jgi:hypothetical protein
MRSLGQEEFFNGYWEYLATHSIASVILHSWQEYPEHIASDVDYCVPQEHLDRIIPLLDDYCQQSGWSLCQIFQHEKTAYFCVCASNSVVGDLIMLDVCGDYTVRGVRHIPSNVFIKNEKFNEQKKFWVLDSAAELAYVLTKAAAKKKNPDEVMGRVQELLGSMDEVNQARVADYLPQQKLLSSEKLFEDPATYLKSSAWARSIGRASGSGWFELVRKVRRVIQPTGFHIQIKALNDEEYYKAAKMLEQALGDTCRNTLVVNPSDNRNTLKGFALAKIKSTLIITSVEGDTRKTIIPKRLGVDLIIELNQSFTKPEEGAQTIMVWALKIRQLMANRTLYRWLKK